ncbi:hypothetical protein J19TS1_38070 [Heyndrickxia oleronia]|nr:hypothetical protein J19TS1_38070 [Heyndrickxia oleronia]
MILSIEDSGTGGRNRGSDPLSFNAVKQWGSDPTNYHSENLFTRYMERVTM